jgi:hypothetical protein
MKVKFLLLIILGFMPVLLFAQGASLTIFSEDGDKFILFLNGQQQNNVSQTNLRLDGLSQPYYKARIVFDDPAKGAIDKSIPVNDPSTNAPADVVYKIKNKDGEMKLRYFSAQPIQQNYTPPADVYVVHYGQPDRSTSVTQTTVTTTNTTANPNGNVSIGISGAGMNMNVNAQDPNMGGTTVTRTTTTTTSYSSDAANNNAGYGNEPRREHEYEREHEHHREGRGCEYPMTWDNFKSAKETVSKESFDETKLSTAKSILAANCFNTEQVIQICKLFSFEANKLDFAKFAYSKTTDQANYFKVNNVFDFDASKTELNNYVSNGGR